MDMISDLLRNTLHTRELIEAAGEVMLTELALQPENLTADYKVITKQALQQINQRRGEDLPDDDAVIDMLKGYCILMMAESELAKREVEYRAGI